MGERLERLLLWHTENPAVSLLDIRSPKARLSLMLLWSRERSRGKGPAEKLRKGPGWEERDELTQVLALRSTATIWGKKPQTRQRRCVREPCPLGTHAGFC